VISYASLHQKYKGLPAAVLGGGPSLPVDLARVPVETLLIAVNHHALEYTNTSYIVFLDPLSNMPMPTKEIRHRGGIFISRQPETDVDLRGSGIWGRFSGQAACWFACYLGCDPVILCGMDLYRNPPPPDQVDNNAYKDPLSLHLEEWRQAFISCPHPERIRAMSGPLIEIFGEWKNE
jgi:hypothetical protein